MLPKCGLLFCAVLLFVLYPEVSSGLTVINAPRTRADPPKQDYDWWKNGVFYQIYPRSFKESGKQKGIGNLEGIKTELETLKDMGVTAIILSQILQSSGTEHSEAILDFKAVHPEYGTMNDFEGLVSAAKTKGIKIILDIVINHSGTKHDWFTNDNQVQPAIKVDEDYYVWSKGLGTGANRRPPNNWLSVYGDSAWELALSRDEYYLHQFGVDQPDLNYNNSKVIEEMKGVLEFWLSKGVDGFRLDAVPFLFENDGLLDEPIIEGVEPYKYESLNHIHTKDQDKTYDLIYKLRQWIDEYNKENEDVEFKKILITEAYTSTENTIRYYENKDKQHGAHIPFNFLLLPHDKQSNVSNIVDSINEWLDHMPEGQTANWLIGNHDHHRAATRFGPDLASNINILIASLPGVMITYNGEEIGQENGEVSYIQCKDPVGCKAGPADFPKVSRDFERTPYQWNSDDKYAGFTLPTADGTWLPVSQGYEDTNLEDQQNCLTKDTNYHNYVDFIEVRKTLKNDTKVKVEVLYEDVIKITRGNGPNGFGNHIILINMGKEDKTLQVSDKEGELYEVIVSTDKSIDPKYCKGCKVWAREVKIRAYKTIVFKVISRKANYDWWKNAVIYQVYPRSFKDSNNDGNGDLQGIIEKLPHLKQMGVDVVWLSPIYKSPQKDAGYDISNFTGIDKIYGNMDDFDELIVLAKLLKIKIVMDFVPNHSSNQHEWFKKSENGTFSDYRDYYVWNVGKDGGPPSNWLSIFKDSAWTWSPTRNQYYLHQFDKSQPDLNYRNLNVQMEMKEVLKFWLDKGVSGFRMDAVPYLVEHKDFTNEPRSNNLEAKENEWKYLQHIYTSDLEETFKIIYDWRDYIDMYTAEHGGDERIMMTEAYTDIYTTMYYYGNGDKRGAHFTFNFQLIEGVNEKSDATDFTAAIKQWIDLIPVNCTSNWVLGNHDKHRLATRFGPKNLDGFNMLAAILPGVMVTYNGEEIGLENGEVSWEQGEDPSACNGPKEDFEKVSRDFERTPFHWDNSTNAGFNNGTKPWLPVSEKYKDTNLDFQINQNNSHYELYKRLLVLRKLPAFVHGTFQVRSVTNNVLASLRNHSTNGSYFHLFNLGENEETFNLKTAYHETTEHLEIVESNDEANLAAGKLLNTTSITLQAHQSVIVMSTNKTMGSSATTHILSSFVILLGLLINTVFAK